MKIMLFNGERVVFCFLDNIAVVAVDIVNGYVFWTDAGRKTLSRAQLNGSGKQDLLTSRMLIFHLCNISSQPV